MSVNVIVYEDNACLLESLVNLLELTEEFRVIGAFKHCKRVEEQVKSLKPKVILMDIDLPDVSGIEAVRVIRKFDSDIQIIILTVFDDNNHIFEALYAGANGYMLKKYISDKLITSIRDVLQGGAPMSPDIARKVIDFMQTQVKICTNDYQLTNREKEILQLLSLGNSFKMIASDLHISLDTVRTHIKHIYDKLHVRSQIEAVSKAINEKLV